MAMSKSAERAYKKAVKAKKKAKRGHWLLIQKGDSVKEVFSDIFALKSCGICCGQSRLAAELLRERGMDIPEGTVKYAELLSAVLSARGGEGK